MSPALKFFLDSKSRSIVPSARTAGKYNCFHLSPPITIIILSIHTISRNVKRKKPSLQKQKRLFKFVLFRLISDTLCEHSVCNLFKARDISARKQIALHTVLLSGIIGVMENVDHNILKLSVNLFKGPAVSH